MMQIASSLLMTGDDDFGGKLYKNRRECFRSLQQHDQSASYLGHYVRRPYPCTISEPRYSHRQFALRLSGGSRKRTTRTVTLSVE